MPSGMRFNNYLDGQECWEKWHLKGMSLKDIVRDHVARERVNPMTGNPPSISGIEKAALNWALKKENLTKARKDLFYSWQVAGKVVKKENEDDEWNKWLLWAGSLIYHQRAKQFQTFINQHDLHKYVQLPDPNIVYSEDYIEACFLEWWKAGRPRAKSSSGSHIVKVIPTAPDGRKPNIVTVRTWMKNYGWEERADALDAQMSIQLEQEAIQERIKSLKEMAARGKALMDKGAKYIEESDNPFKDNPSAAVRAIATGADMQFRFSGAANHLANIASMSDAAIQKEVLKLLGKNENEVITVEPEDVEPSEPEDNDGSSDNS